MDSIVSAIRDADVIRSIAAMQGLCDGGKVSCLQTSVQNEHSEMHQVGQVNRVIRIPFLGTSIRVIIARRDGVCGQVS